MTNKYLDVRRELFEQNPSSRLNTYRSLSDMVRLFKRPIWIMIGALIITIIGLIVVTLFFPESPFIWVLISSIFIITLFIQIPREKYLYNESERANELAEKKQDYEHYLVAVWKIFRNNGIDNSKKVMKLKIECEATIKMREDKFAKINTKFVDMLIGVPLGALIASVIYSDSKAVPTAIGAIILGGLAILGLIKLINLISYYSEEYFKDKYLLDALNELEYYDKALE